jgi:hypothetical protein
MHQALTEHVPDVCEGCLAGGHSTVGPCEAAGAADRVSLFAEVDWQSGDFEAAGTLEDARELGRHHAHVHLHHKNIKISNSSLYLEL